MDIVLKLNALKKFFQSGATQSLEFRKKQLTILKQIVLKYEQEIYEALMIDLKKSKEEVWVTETGFLLTEINEALRNIDDWMKPKKVRTNLLNLPSSSYIQQEPLGVILIIGPWNYPLQLLLTPLVGAIAAGNTVVLKPSEFAPATQAILKKIIEDCFDENYVLFVEGDGATVVPEMMNNYIFDHVFYTGSTFVGKIIYQMAAQNLVPVTLELGGKSPCVVTADANIKVAARRIAVIKYSNCGQMCVAPDYVMVHESIEEEFTKELIICIEKFYTTDPQSFEGYGKMINEKQFNRVVSYLTNASIVYGGKADAEHNYIQPTIITKVSSDDAVMKDEIFGPILPILSFKNDEEALSVIQRNSNPLAFYVFSSSQKVQDFWLQKVPSGGACVNNASWHLTNHNLPFGGRGFSGMGNYHGKHSFKTFSHSKAVLRTPTWFDPAMKYPPFKGKLGLFKKVIG